MKRKDSKLLLCVKQLLFVLVLTLFSGTAYSQTYTFSYTGSSQTLALPAGNYSIECWGADGGKGFQTSQILNNGKGGYSFGILNLPSTQTLTIYAGGLGTNADGVTVGQVAAGGFNGGGPSGANNYATVTQYRAGGGGGGSDVRVGGTAFSDRVIVAGGGGGGVYLITYAGGNGGAATGGNGGNTYNGTGGTQIGGGLANGSAGNIAGTPGILGIGGNGGTAATKSGGGGGGGGYYGGGGGATGNTSSSQGSGGGGSGYIGGVTTATTAMTGQAGFVANPDATGNGRVIIKQICSISLSVTGLNASGAMCSGNSVTITTNAISNYSWTTGSTASSLIVSPTSNTVYGLTATSPATCSTSALVSINVSVGSPTLNVTQTTTNICLGESVTFSASGALSYSWSAGSSIGTVVNGIPYFPSATSNYTVVGQNGCGIGTATAAVSISPYTVNATVSSPTICSGFSANLNAVAAGASYTWAPGAVTSQSFVATPTSSILYTVTASNGTCVGTNTVQLGVIPLPTIVASASSPSTCTGGPVVLNVTGGATFTWSPGGQPFPTFVINPTVTAQYDVSSTSSLGCVSGSSVMVTVYPLPTVNIDIADPFICKGGQALLGVNGADTYLWSTGSTASSVIVTPIQNALYGVTGTYTLSNCTASQTVMVNVFTPTLAISGNNVICEGTTATLTANSGGAISYGWSDGLPNQSIIIAPLTNTIYVATATVSAFNIACVAMNSIQVTVNSNPNIVPIANMLTLCVNEQVMISATGGTAYVWSWGSQTSNAPSIAFTPTINNKVIVNVVGTGTNGCTNIGTVALMVNSCTGLNEASLSSDKVQVYPNPSTGDINVTFGSAAQLLLIGETGQLIRKLDLNEENDYKVSVSGLSNGIYFITGQNGTQSINKKVIINK